MQAKYPTRSWLRRCGRHLGTDYFRGSFENLRSTTSRKSGAGEDEEIRSERNVLSGSMWI